MTAAALIGSASGSLSVVIVITETRFGGTYEGGPWAAFAVDNPSSVPHGAFDGDPSASTWWDAPTVPVGVGDSPDHALAHLRFLLERDASRGEHGYFAPGDAVRVARCTPDHWYGDGTGVVRGVEFRPVRPFAGGLRGTCVYTVDFDHSGGVRVPESYLRRA